jgi:hypothetical protein
MPLQHRRVLIGSMTNSRCRWRVAFGTASTAAPGAG